MHRLVIPSGAACLVLGVAAIAIGSGVLPRLGDSPYKAVLQTSATTVVAREGLSGSYAVVSGDKVVAPGDAIRTNETGTAVLTHYDGSTVALSPLTELVVEDLNGTDHRVLYLTIGRIAVSVTKLIAPDSRYEVRTPSATLGVRGTRFVVTVAADGRTEVDVSEGRVALSASGESVELGGGEGGVVERPGARPTKKGVAASPTPPVPPAPPTAPSVAFQFAVDRQTVGYGEPFRYCIEGSASVTDLMRLGLVGPDGVLNERGQFGAQRFPDPATLCRTAAFDPRTGFPPGDYTFRWRVNGAPAEFSVALASVAPTFRLDRDAVGLGAPFVYCIDGPAAITELKRVALVYPDGRVSIDGFARSFTDVGTRCRQFTFESTSTYPAGAYRFRWLIDAAAVEFMVTLTDGTPPPVVTPPPVAAPVVTAPPCVPGSPTVGFDRATFRMDEVANLVIRGVCAGTPITVTSMTTPTGSVRTYNTVYTYPNIPTQYHLAAANFSPPGAWPLGPYTYTYVINGTSFRATITLVR